MNQLGFLQVIEIGFLLYKVFLFANKTGYS